MSYSDDAVRAKLSSLNETQDSIVTVAQWIMFHRRHADRTASLWLTRLQESNTAKRLNLIYLANEVVQQSRARQKNDFLLAFEPVISDATALAYKNASQEVQGKLRRVVEVWRGRNIFDPRIQDTTERRLDEVDKARGVNGAGGSSGRKLGGSLFGGSGGGNVPAELEGLVKGQAGLSKAEAGVKPAVDKANEEFAKMTDPDTPIPTAPLHAAKLSALMKHLAAAQGAVEASIKARKELLTELERLVESNRSKLAEDETTATDLMNRKESTEIKKKEVEDNIMRGLSTPTSPENPTPDPFSEDQPNGAAGAKRARSNELEAPEAEGFTPPPPDVETFTPPPDMQADLETGAGDPAPVLDSLTAAEVEEQGFTTTTGAESFTELAPSFTEPTPSFEPPPALPSQNSAAAAANAFLDNLHLGVGQVRQASSEFPTGSVANGGNTGDPRLKRRKMSHKRDDMEMEEGFFGVGGEGVDEEGVSALLGP